MPEFDPHHANSYRLISTLLSNFDRLPVARMCNPSVDLDRRVAMRHESISIRQPPLQHQAASLPTANQNEAATPDLKAAQTMLKQPRQPSQPEK